MGHSRRGERARYIEGRQALGHSPDAAMRHKFAVALFLVVLGAVSAEKPKTYTSKYDNVDVDSILGNSRILTSYIKCMLDEGPCTPDARDLKSEYLRDFAFPTCGRPPVTFWTNNCTDFRRQSISSVQIVIENTNKPMKT